jgi:hypothetical protein
MNEPVETVEPGATAPAHPGEAPGPPRLAETQASTDETPTVETPALTSAAETAWDSLPLLHLLAPLEERVRRLEEALALRRAAPAAAVPAAPAATAMPAPAPTNITDSPPVAAMAPITNLPDQPPSPLPPVELPRRNRTWLPLDILTEARVILRMFVDPRYSMSWSGRTIPLVLLALFLTSWWWVPLTSITGFGYLINKTADLAICFVLFKVLGHEARRYRRTAPDLPASMRLHDEG